MDRSTEGTGGRVAVVTGGSAGVGRAVVRALSRRGFAVGIVARGRARLEAARAEIEAAGGRAAIATADVADAEAVERAADGFAAELGEIDLWVNNAMVTVYSPVEEMTADEYRRVTEVTYLGQVHGTLAALRRMAPADRGTVVQVGSALAYRSIPLQSAYCAAKAAVRAFTDSLRCELMHRDSAIRLVAVHLPAVNTPQFDWARSRMPRRLQPVPPIHQPEAVAEAIVDAALDGRRETWIGASTMQAILGQMAAPSVLDRMMARDAWQGQMTDEAAEAGRPDNLFDPVDGDVAAHGRFDGRSRDEARSASASTVRAGLLAAGIGAAAGLALAGAAAARARGRR